MKRINQVLTVAAMLAGGGFSHSAFPDADTAVASEKPADKAVGEYLRLRRAGKRHHEALSNVRAEFGLSDQEINQAANQLGSDGYPSDGLEGAALDRSPAADE